MPDRKWLGGYIRNGIYWIDKRDHRHKVSTRCRTREGALAQLAEYEADPEGYVRGVRQRTDLAEAVRRYLEFSTAKNSPDHVKSQGQAFDRWVGFLASHRVSALQDLSPALVASYMQWRIAGGGGRVRKDAEGKELPPRPVGPASFNRDLAAMTALFSWARNTDLIREDVNPFRKVHQLPENREVRPHRYVERDEILAARTKLTPKWADAVTVLYGTAFRWGSLQRMRPEHVDARKMMVRDPYPKGRVAVEVPVSSEVLRAALRAVDQSYPDDKAAQLSRRLRSACRRAGVDRFTAHDLRVSAATWAHRQGIPLKDLQRLLGHADMVTTQRYVRSEKGRFAAPI